jgi:plastocyanin
MSPELRRPLNRVIAVLGAAAIVTAGTALVACGGQGTDNHAAQSGSAAKAVDHVQIADFAYAPAAITVRAGATITFTNDDSAPHTATSGTSPTADGVFDTGTLKKGKSKTVKVTKPGTFAYYCAIHPFMKATVTVR